MSPIIRDKIWQQSFDGKVGAQTFDLKSGDAYPYDPEFWQSSDHRRILLTAFEKNKFGVPLRGVKPSILMGYQRNWILRQYGFKYDI
jgi:hypothetical protein